MGTRSLTHVHDSGDATLLTFYKQHDGYPEGWGKELAKFLTGFRIVNGLCGGNVTATLFSGAPEQFAAFLTAREKAEA